MTSNIGAHFIQQKMEALTDENKEATMVLVREEVYEMLRQVLRPEFLNRIDETIVFSPLTQKDVAAIVRIQTDDLCEKLKEMGISIKFDDSAIQHIAKEAYDPQYGARPVKRFLQKKSSMTFLNKF